MDKRRLKQWLLYMPRDPGSIKFANGVSYISKELTLDILRFIFLQLYADAHIGDAAYLAHLEQELDKYAKSLPENVEVTRNARR
jgi:hypothetical protein